MSCVELRWLGDDGLVHRLLLKVKGQRTKIDVLSVACGRRNFTMAFPPTFSDEQVTCMACIDSDAKGA